MPMGMSGTGGHFKTATKCHPALANRHSNVRN